MAAVDRGGRVLALLGGEAFCFGQGVAEPGVLLLEGGDEPGSAVPPGLLSFGVCLGHSGWPVFRYVTNVLKRAYRYVTGVLR